jgi:hypothetical protein
MELIAVLLLCAVTALVLYRVISHPVLPRRPDGHHDERHPDAPMTGSPQVRGRSF